MLLRSRRFLTLVLTALALTMTSAHLLELPQKLRYDPKLYAAVNSTMYRYFAIVGGVYQMGSILTAALLVYLVRRRGDALRWTLAGSLAAVLGFVSWLALVAPVNRQVVRAVSRAPNCVPALWESLRDRWEYGHATGFVLQLIGFSALVVSVLVETPARRLD